jgi:hypothetical protein
MGLSYKICIIIGSEVGVVVVLHFWILGEFHLELELDVALVHWNDDIWDDVGQDLRVLLTDFGLTHFLSLFWDCRGLSWQINSFYLFRLGETDAIIAHPVGSISEVVLLAVCGNQIDDDSS